MKDTVKMIFDPVTDTELTPARCSICSTGATARGIASSGLNDIVMGMDPVVVVGEIIV
jgi:hypothetical protein